MSRPRRGPASRFAGASRRGPSGHRCRPANARPGKGPPGSCRSRTACYWLARRKVEDLGRGHPAPGELQQVGGHGQQGVGLAQRPVSQARPQLGRPGQVRGTEAGVDQWGEQLDVGAHDDDVAGLERRVVGQQVEHGLADHLHLAGAAVAGMHRRLSSSSASSGRGSSASAGPGPRGRPVGADVSLDTTEQGRSSRPVLDRAVLPPVTPWAASTSCISRASRPQERSSGFRADGT